MSDDRKLLDDISTFLETVKLPELVIGIEDAEKPIDLLNPVFDQLNNQSIVIGSQIAGFSSDVPLNIRPMISNIFLLAQLVADKKTDGAATGSRSWYSQYIDTLTKLGWNISGQSDANQQVTGTSFEVHREIIPVITAALGPAAVAATTIIRVLEGLDNIDKDQPWLTLFNQKSQRASANQFQFSQTIMEGNVPTTTLVGFDLDAHKSVTQILFFKFSTNEASLTYFEQKFSPNTTILEHSANQVQNLVLEHITSNIAELDGLDL